jgi:hypothetical protein
LTAKDCGAAARQAVKGNAPDDLLEDEDDDDFVLDWDELLQMGDDGPMDIQDDTPDDTPPEMLLPEPRGPRTRGRRKGAYIYQPKWLRWNYRERPLESTVRLQTRYVTPWRWAAMGAVQKRCTLVQDGESRHGGSGAPRDALCRRT